MTGSHRQPLHAALAPLQRAHYIDIADLGLPGEDVMVSAAPEWADATFGTVGTDLPAQVCAARPGDCLYWHHSLFHAAFFHFVGRTFFALKFAEKPRSEADHASNWRLSPGIYEPCDRWLRHPDPMVRRLVVPVAGQRVVAHAAAHAAPWGSEDATFFGKHAEHYSLPDLDWHDKAVAAAAAKL